MELNDFQRPSGEWLSGGGPQGDIVISSRVRLARNLAGFKFVSRASEDDRAEVVQLVSDEVKRTQALPGSKPYVDLDRECPLDRLFLVERHLISKELMRGAGARGVIYEADEVASLMVNEEDHVRLQVVRAGFDLEACWERATRIDDALARRLRFAFSDRYGFLTACPTNCGTGIRISVMLHLPALVMIDHTERVKAAVGKMNFAVRGLFGEGSRALGDLFQVSNQVTLGRTEEELISDLKAIVPRIVRYERAARGELLRKRKSYLEDKIWRALGILSTARRISSDEALDCLSAVRLGVNADMMAGIEARKINELFLFSQPAHLQKLERRVLGTEERDTARAEFLRKNLHGVN